MVIARGPVTCGVRHSRSCRRERMETPRSTTEQQFREILEPLLFGRSCVVSLQTAALSASRLFLEWISSGRRLCRPYACCRQRHCGRSSSTSLPATPCSILTAAQSCFAASLGLEWQTAARSVGSACVARLQIQNRCQFPHHRCRLCAPPSPTVSTGVRSILLVGCRIV
jgi:hypothetical protein